MQDGNTVQFLSVAGKVLTCPELTRVTMVESVYGRAVVTQGLKPARIRMGMARQFGLSEADMPILRQVQWHYTKKTLYRNDDHDEIQGQIDRLAYGPEVSDTSSFSFEWERDIREKPDVGNGSDEDPFLVA
ncbi:hypothetical protein F441_21150 [Phytophthora nicotianae CJ01A1]|uniref:Uncharacterized protein n=1 Tax=Phytophthora nicotianae CJ01A1 TaxID=1317063 RepID=W2VWA8_PHYNI|nr:hypothetical protein F441_21150 [Phytophthora nicotianae CJ01A1]